jgi:hypothetical protein
MIESNVFVKLYAGTSFVLAHTDRFQEQGQQYNTLDVATDDFNRTLLYYGIKLGGNKNSFKSVSKLENLTSIDGTLSVKYKSNC